MFTDLLVEYLDSREEYNNACMDSYPDMMYLDNLESVMIAAKNELNDFFENYEKN